MTIPATPSLQMIDRDDAIAQIAATFTDRSGYLVLPPYGGTLATAERIAELPGWWAFVDNGSPLAMRVTSVEPLVLAEVVDQALGRPSTATVFVVPKTVPPAQLGAAIGQPEMTAEQDLISMTAPEGPAYAWPELLVAAMDIAAPEVAAGIRASRDPGFDDDGTPAAVRAVQEAFQGRARRGAVGACQHVAGGGADGVAVWSPWSPGEVRCWPCHERAAASALSVGSADYRCDGCGGDVRSGAGGLHGCSLRLRGTSLPRLSVPVTTVVVVFGLCAACVGGPGVDQ